MAGDWFGSMLSGGAEAGELPRRGRSAATPETRSGPPSWTPERLWEARLEKVSSVSCGDRYIGLVAPGVLEVRELETGELRWEADVPRDEVASLAVDGDYFVAATSRFLAGASCETGELLWSHAGASTVVAAGAGVAVVANGVRDGLAVPGSAAPGSLHMVDLVTGESVGADVPSNLRQVHAVSDSGVVVSAAEGEGGDGSMSRRREEK